MPVYTTIHTITFSKTNNGSVQLIPVSVMRKVAGGELTDLTGTTWLFNDVPSTYSSTTTTFNLNFKYGDLFPSASLLILTSSGKIVYFPEVLSIDEIGYVQTDASLTNMGWGIWNDMLGEFSPNTSYKTIQITGGTDATNSNLITYLQQNATLTSGGSSDTLQPINLFSTIEVQAPSTISFTIAGTTYQAEEGMTWYEWVNSEYNTNNFTCAGSNGLVHAPNNFGLGSFVFLNGNYVIGGDTIQSNAVYVVTSGGSND